MNIPYLIGFSIFAVIFIVFLFRIGIGLFKVKSFEKLAKEYQKNPKKFTWFEKYYLGFAFWNGKVMLWTTDSFGDGFVTFFYRFAGIVFMLFAVAFIAGTIALWYLNLVPIV